MVEQLIRNQQVRGSSPRAGSTSSLPFALFYGVLTLGMTFPLVTKLSSHVPMPEYLQNEPWRHVYWFLLWSLWLAKKSVGLWPPLALSTTLIFYPAGVVLPTIVQVVSAAVVALPLLGALNLVAVGNILMLLGITFAGYFAFLLAEYVTADRAASLLAGVVFAFSPIVGANLQGHLYVVTGLPWIPLYLLFVLKTLDHPTKGNALRAGGIFAITMLSYWYYAAFLVVFTGVLVLASLLSAERRLDLRALVVPTLSFAAVVIPVTIILAIPFLLPSTRNWLAAAPLQSSLAEMKDWSVDALAFFLPAYDHWLFGGAVRGIRASFGGNFTLQTGRRCGPNGGRASRSPRLRSGSRRQASPCAGRPRALPARGVRRGQPGSACETPAQQKRRSRSTTADRESSTRCTCPRRVARR